MNRITVRNLLVGLALAALLVPAAASASSELEGIGVVWAKDFGLRTVTIGQNVYHLTENTTLTGRGGERLVFVGVPVARDENGWLRGVKQATVQFAAHERRGRLYLDALALIEPPE